MKYIFSILLLICVLNPVSSQEWEMDDITIYRSFDAFEHILQKDNDTLYVVNFWATWCAPCVKELPYFEALNESYKDDKLKVVLVSLDFERQLETRLLKFLNKNGIQSEVVVLLDGKESEWIDRVDPRWSGAIPITIFYKGSERKFFEKSFHSESELKEIVNKF